MQLTGLRLINFRNHRRTELVPSPGLNVVFGANAQGKSSLLEAVELASTGRSRRAARETELITLGEAWAHVHAETGRADRREQVDLAFRRDASAPIGAAPDAGSPGAPLSSDRVWREIRLNGVAVRRGALFGHLLCVVSDPYDADVAGGAPVFRRRMVDVLLAQISPAYYYTAQRYTRALLQRNRALRAGRAAPSDLEPWDEQIASLGAAITLRRRDLVVRLAEKARRVHRALSEGREELAVTYVPNLVGAGEEDLARAAREALAGSRRAEVVRGVTLAGPHRDDVLLEVDGRALRVYGSRGQHLAVMLALRLAEREVLREETGEEPILLLDEVVMALDERRQAQLLASLRGAQALITLTTVSTLPAMPRETALFRVAGGTVEAQPAHLA